MRAIGFHAYGATDVLAIVDVPAGVPGARQVRIRTRATPVNPADVWFREGGVSKLVGDAERPLVPGLELAGEVESAGPESRFSPGQRVLAVTTFIATGRGAHAELVVVDDDDVALVPAGMSLSAASTIPMNGLTALAALDATGLGAGGTLAVVGAAGAVGGFVVQLARARGMRVIAIASDDDRRTLTEWGAEHVVARHELVAGTRAIAPGGVDALVDCATVGPAAMPAVRSGGMLVLLRPLAASGAARARDLGLRTKLVSARAYQGDAARLEGLVELVRSGRLRLRPTTQWGVHEAVRAHEAVAAGGIRRRQVLVWP